MKAAIVGLEGPRLTPDEAELFRAHPPAGAVLFGRNVRSAAQVRDLVGALRQTLPAGAVLMVDQEGGRVARLRPPDWRAHPPAATLGRRFTDDGAAGLRAAWLTGALIGLDCAAAGFDVVAAPVLDRAIPGAHAVIGDRAPAADTGAVAQIGGAIAAGLLAAGIQPVGKHAPGHGRALADSHLALPRVEADADSLAEDLLPFALNADLPWLMTAHILYPVWDAELPATLSPAIIGGIIRGRIGFRGVLVTDDLAMQALTGAPFERAVRALGAGCDIALYCSGEFAPTAALLAACPDLTDAARERLDAAYALAASRRLALNAEVLAAERDRLLA